MAKDGSVVTIGALSRSTRASLDGHTGTPESTIVTVGALDCSSSPICGWSGASAGAGAGAGSSASAAGRSGASGRACSSAGAAGCSGTGGGAAGSCRGAGGCARVGGSIALQVEEGRAPVLRVIGRDVDGSVLVGSRVDDTRLGCSLGSTEWVELDVARGTIVCGSQDEGSCLDGQLGVPRIDQALTVDLAVGVRSRTSRENVQLRLCIAEHAPGVGVVTIEVLEVLGHIELVAPVEETASAVEELEVAGGDGLAAVGEGGGKVEDVS